MRQSEGRLKATHADIHMPPIGWFCAATSYPGKKARRNRFRRAPDIDVSLVQG
ncbi:hypothetical protein [Bradyrhizobium sp. USDA 4454]